MSFEQRLPDRVFGVIGRAGANPTHWLGLHRRVLVGPQPKGIRLTEEQLVAIGEDQDLCVELTLCRRADTDLVRQGVVGVRVVKGALVVHDAERLELGGGLARDPSAGSWREAVNLHVAQRPTKTSQAAHQQERQLLEVAPSVQISMIGSSLTAPGAYTPSATTES